MLAGYFKIASPQPVCAILQVRAKPLSKITMNHMHHAEQKISYFLYARKSSESEDRQIQSVDDQVDRLKKFATQHQLKISHIFTEAKSAKKPNNRPIFKEMLARIEKGEARGILCWQINRLSRNPADSGNIGWLLQQRVIESIQTPDKEYLPEDNALLFAVETGVANQFILDLSKNVRRGVQRKLEDGWRPGMAPIGYMNDLATHTILKDPERFNLMRKAWDLMLTGNFTVPQVLEKLNDDWGFRTMKKRRIGNKPLAMSGMYKIFTNMFYAGIIVHKGKHYKGKHAPMITIEEYDHVQLILGRKGKPRPKKHVFPFTGFIHCGECGCLHTAETKRKLIKSTNQIKEYTYYHCTKKKRALKCSQKNVLSEKDLHIQIERELEKYEIMPEFLSWALDVIESKKGTLVEDSQKILEMKQRAIFEKQNQLKNLTQMRYRDLIDDVTFVRERDLLQKEIEQHENGLRSAESKNEKQLELTKKTFIFAAYAHKTFLFGNTETKRELVFHLGSNHEIKDQKFSIQAKEWFMPIANNYPVLHNEFKRLEPMISGSIKAKSEQLSSLIARWHGVRESNPRQKFWRLSFCH